MDSFATKTLKYNGKCYKGTSFPVPKDAKKDDITDIIPARVFQSL